jgi:uncharacterized membrane protein YphA (DoxX/SURF4 family)
MASLIVAPGPQSIGSWIMGLLGVVVGTALLLGILTPVAGALAALCNLCNCVIWLLASGTRGSIVITVYLIVMSMVVVLLGPGAFSLDAYLFGPREIAIPGAPRSRGG